MSNLKFRGFHQGQPVYFTFENLIGDKCGNPCVIIDKPNDVIMGGTYVSIHILENVTQFTGISDKYGVDIYEGDFIRDNRNWKIIKQIVYIGVRFTAHCVLMPTGVANDYFYPDSCEVVGNIHQNPELLKA